MTRPISSCIVLPKIYPPPDKIYYFSVKKWHFSYLKKAGNRHLKNQDFILFSLSTFLRRVCEGASFSFPPPACFFNPDPKILKELASKVGQKKTRPCEASSNGRQNVQLRMAVSVIHRSVWLP
jgi:hypothetical protein